MNRTKNCGYRNVGVILFSILMLVPLVQAGTSVEPAVKAKKSTAELEALRDQIQKIKKEIDQGRSQSGDLRKQLEESEAEVEKAIKANKELDEKIRKKNEALEALEKEQKVKVDAFNQHKAFMSEQMRVAYINQNQSVVKLVLNNEDPTVRSRNQVYHQYFSKARSAKIDQVGQQLQEIENLKKVTAYETEQLRILKANQQQSLQAVEQKQQQRQLIIANLDKELSGKGARLKRMKQDTVNLGELVVSLNKAARLAKLEKMKRSKSFSNLKGKLKWPSSGAISHRYGTSRNGSSLNWKGMLINSPFGSDVKVISSGQVIFSGWFQNLGKLIIVDHGQEYMSLYGHNSELFRSVGDKVKTGELIASVGDSGGRKNSGLYFEIRQKGRAVNPSIWCKGQFKQASS
ncbi:MAG: murein hydrolase activator EnvC [Gammaproteobacteria bacterium]